ncbi:MAG: hypothetical protein AABX89_07375 [Candidatus Thermoplasmatota archaeon]
MNRIVPITALFLLAAATAQAPPEFPPATLPIGPGYVLEIDLPIQMNVTLLARGALGDVAGQADNASVTAGGLGEVDPALGNGSAFAASTFTQLGITMREADNSIPTCLPPSCFEATLPAPVVCGVRDANTTIPYIQTCRFTVRCEADACEGRFGEVVASQGGQDGSTLLRDVLLQAPNQVAAFHEEPQPAANSTSATPPATQQQKLVTYGLVGGGALLAYLIGQRPRSKNKPW